MGEVRIPCTIMRGGTSKGLFFLDSDLPSEPALRERVLLQAFGSPDSRQIDGLGGADPLTSKLAIIRPASAPGVDVEYLFGQVSIDRAHIDFTSNCGNISSAVGPFALHQKLVSAREPTTRVRILNTNTQKMILSEVPVLNGSVSSEGEYEISGVPGTGPEIRLHFLDPGGSATGRMLPTGQVRDRMVLQDGRTVDVTIVDAGNPTAFVGAEDLGLRGDESVEELQAQTAALDSLEEIRARTSQLLGFSSDWRQVFHKYSSIPKIAFVAKAAAYTSLQGKPVGRDEVDLLARVLAMGRVHKAFAVTAAVPAAAAALLKDSVVHDVCGGSGGVVRIGHPSGVLSVWAKIREDGSSFHLEEVVVGRTARRLMEGFVYVAG